MYRGVSRKSGAPLVLPVADTHVAAGGAGARVSLTRMTNSDSDTPLELPPGGASALSRRDFVSLVGWSAAGFVMTGGVVACGNKGISTPPGTETGGAAGLVLDLQGVPQAGFGQLILMYPSGHHTGQRVTPDAGGRFRFDGLTPGEYQIRFNASGQAIIPEPYQHPIKFAVRAGETADVPVRIQRGNFGQNQVEIYCGDDFFQLQPDGQENGEVTVRLGTVVCWYNVGQKVHTVTGGPWNDSGDMQRTQSYIWVASQTGLFPYRCKYNQPVMQAVLRVEA